MAHTAVDSRSLATDVERRALDRSLLGGIAWTGATKWAAQLLSWASTLVVARILTPADYGLVGMAMVFLGFVQLVNEFGLTAPIIQQRQLTEDQLSRLGGLAALLGVSFCMLCGALAGAVAGFFGEPAVRGIVAVLSLTFALRGLQVLPRALLAKELRFRALAGIEAAEAVTLTAVTLSLALAGAGYWALVGGPIVGALVATAAFARARPHRVAWPRRFRSLVGAVRFGWHVAVGQTAWYVYSNADFAVVGRVLGKAALGAYSFGWHLASVPVERVSALLARVAPPVFAAVQHDRAALRRYFCGLTEGLALVTFPAALGLALVADEFVLAVLGEKWRAAVLPLRILAFYGGLRSVMTIVPQLLIATGQARLTMWFSVTTAVFLPALFLAGSRWGPAGVAAAWVVGYPLVAIPLFLRQALATVQLSAAGFLAALWPALSSSAFMTGIVTAVRLATPDAWPLGLQLGLHVAAGAFSYGAIVFALHRDRLRTFTALVREVRR